jgi:hypothetical protein
MRNYFYYWTRNTDNGEILTFYSSQKLEIGQSFTKRIRGRNLKLIVEDWTYAF